MIPRPSWLTIPRLALAGLVAVLLILAAPAFRRTDPDVALAERNGYIAARSAIRHRQLATVALARLDTAKSRTDAGFRSAADRLKQTEAAFMAALTGPVVIDSEPHPILGPHLETDTLMALPQVRLEIGAVLDTARLIIDNLQGMMMIERGRASLAISHLEAAIIAQDTVILGLRATIQKNQKSVWRRASGGVITSIVAVSCGGAGYLIAGPIAGIGAGALCAAAAGVFR